MNPLLMIAIGFAVLLLVDLLALGAWAAGDWWAARRRARHKDVTTVAPLRDLRRY